MNGNMWSGTNYNGQNKLVKKMELGRVPLVKEIPYTSTEHVNEDYGETTLDFFFEPCLIMSQVTKLHHLYEPTRESWWTDWWQSYTTFFDTPTPCHKLGTTVLFSNQFQRWQVKYDVKVSVMIFIRNVQVIEGSILRWWHDMIYGHRTRICVGEPEL